MRLRNKNGWSLIELTVGIGLAAFAVISIAQAFPTILKTQKQSSEGRNMDLELARAIGDVLRVGRIAQKCERDGTFLKCRVDRNIPPTQNPSDDETYRFGMVGCVPASAPCEFQWLRLNGGDYHKLMSYEGIVGFEICDDAKMRYVGADASMECHIPQTTLSTRHLANVDANTFATPQDRFFRFQIMARTPEDVTHRAIQSSFWVRHPVAAGFLYQWGEEWGE